MAIIYRDQPIDPHSRATRKDNLEVLRKLGMELVALPDGKFARLDLPDAVRDVVAEARRLTAPDARRRHLLHVQARLDECDEEQLARCLNFVERAPTPPKANAEAPLAASLIDGGDHELFALSARFDTTQLQTLRQAVRRARKDLEKGKSRAAAVAAIAACIGTLLPA